MTFWARYSAKILQKDNPKQPRTTPKKSEIWILGFSPVYYYLVQGAVVRGRLFGLGGWLCSIDTGASDNKSAIWVISAMFGYVSCTYVYTNNLRESCSEEGPLWGDALPHFLNPKPTTVWGGDSLSYLASSLRGLCSPDMPFYFEDYSNVGIRLDRAYFLFSWLGGGYIVALTLRRRYTLFWANCSLHTFYGPTSSPRK